MTDFITTAFVQDYKNTVMMLAQTEGSRLRPLITGDIYKGKAGKAVEQFGSTKATKRTSRHADTPLMDVPQYARWVFPSDYEWGALIDDQDKLRMAIDPTSPIAKAGAMAMGRAMDDEILAALYGTAKTGENGTDSTVFDTSGQVVGPNVGGTSTNLNVAKLREIKRIFMANNLNLEREPIHMIVTSKEADALLGETQITSVDFNDRPVLVDGKVTRFLGINFHHLEFGNSAEYDNYASMLNSTNRYCPAFLPSALHIGVWEDTVAKMTERADKGYATQVYLKNTVGGTRLDEKRIIRVECAG